MALSFDLALRDPRLIRERIRRRGADGAGRGWPSLWLEGTAYEYVVGRDPFPPVGTPRRKLALLAEERQVSVPARVATGLPAGGAPRVGEGIGCRRGRRRGLASWASRGGRARVRGHMLVLVHAWPACPARPRPSLEDSCGRHERLLGELAPAAEAKGAAVAWHALWRLPPSMTWGERGRDAWMRYPAVSVTAGVRPLGPEGGHKVT